MRIVTLLPAATEIVAALGADAELVGTSHECDWPPQLAGRPRVTMTPIDPEAPGATIDAQVRRLKAAARPVIAVDGHQHRVLAPDLIITQGLCDVCAVIDGEVHRLAAALASPPRVLSLTATDLAGIWQDIRAVAAAIGREAAAETLITAHQARLVALAERRTATQPRVVCIEWLDPPFLAGHWVPELVAAAGGADVGAGAGSHSVVRPWQAIRALAPDLILVLLCGMNLERARRELATVTDADALALFGEHPTWLLDGNAYTSRPGPRVVDGAERIQAALQDRAMAGLERWRP
jgi:iron complex transport system substrate-binding protein